TLGAVAVATGIALWERNRALAMGDSHRFTQASGCEIRDTGWAGSDIAHPASRIAAREGELFAGARLFGGLVDFWIARETSWTWSLALWAVVAGLALVYARRERSGGMRAAGYLLAYGA